MLMLGFRGTELKPGDPFWADLKELHLGGVILFDYDVASRSPVRNIESADQVRKLTSALQAASSIPLFIAIDQEGGKIARLQTKHGFPAFPSQAELGRLDDEATTRANARTMAQLLRTLGINVNFAPVLDLAVNPDNPVIAKLERSYGADPKLVARHAQWTIEELHRAGIFTAVKHFPGHGSSREDSHLGLPDVTAVWSPLELQPFGALIGKGLPDMVMTAHLYNKNWDKDSPATLSKTVITGMLRRSLGFDGVVVSDDLQMGAIAQTVGLEEAIRQAIYAGVDILLFGNNLNHDPQIARKATQIIKNLVARGDISPDRLHQSFQRIQQLKKRVQ